MTMCFDHGIDRRQTSQITELTEEVVDGVVPEEQVGNRGIYVVLWVSGEIDWEVKAKSLTTLGTVVVQVVGAAIWNMHIILI
jgi:hypothetical protein